MDVALNLRVIGDTGRKKTTTVVVMMSSRFLSPVLAYLSFSSVFRKLPQKWKSISSVSYVWFRIRTVQFHCHYEG